MINGKHDKNKLAYAEANDEEAIIDLKVRKMISSIISAVLLIAGNIDEDKMTIIEQHDY